MKTTRRLTALFCALLLAAPAATLAQDMTMGLPAEQHEALTSRAGKWNATISVWMVPGGEPMAIEAVATIEPMLGGRYVKETIEANMMGQPYTGVGITGYDRWAKAYQMVWMDNMGTSMTTSHGPDYKDLTATIRNPINGAPTETRMKTTLKGDDEHLFEMFAVGPEGEMKTMEIHYKRQ